MKLSRKKIVFGSGNVIEQVIGVNVLALGNFSVFMLIKVSLGEIKKKVRIVFYFSFGLNIRNYGIYYSGSINLYFRFKVDLRLGI